MATMNISLPEQLRQFVEEQVSRGGYSSVSEYMRELVRKAKSDKELEAKLLDALHGEDLGDVDPEFFSKLRDHARNIARNRVR
jgi:antitoxin ParD1/3/4